MSVNNSAPSNHLEPTEASRSTKTGTSDISLQDIQRIIEVTPDIIIIADRDGTLRYVNPASFNTYGYHPHEMIGRPYTDFMHTDDIEPTEEKRYAITGGETVYHYVSRVRHKDPHHEPVHLQWSATLNPEDGKIYAICRNITGMIKEQAHHHKLNQEKEKAQQLASTLFAISKGRELVIRQMGHDLGNLLMPLLGNLELLREAIKTSEGDLPTNLCDNLNTRIDIIENTINNMSSLIEFKLKESKGKDSQEEPIDLNTLITRCVELLRPELSQQVTLHFTPHPDFQLFISIRHLIHSVVMNLLSNAVKHTYRGDITITLHISRLSPSNSEVIIEIKDTGVGMDTEFIEQIKLRSNTDWDNTSEHTHFKNHGFGIYQTIESVGKLGGKISYHSEKGVGTTVKVVLPLKRLDSNDLANQPIPLISTHDASVTDLQYFKDKEFNVLLVEDSSIIANIVERHLKQIGCVVTHVTTAKAAIEQYHEQNRYFECILMDINLLGEHNGFWAVEQIRQWENQQNNVIPTYIAMTSGDVDQEARDRASEVGANIYCLKPYTRQTLYQVLKNCEEQRHRSSQFQVFNPLSK